MLIPFWSLEDLPLDLSSPLCGENSLPATLVEYLKRADVFGEVLIFARSDQLKKFQKGDGTVSSLLREMRQGILGPFQLVESVKDLVVLDEEALDLVVSVLDSGVSKVVVQVPSPFLQGQALEGLVTALEGRIPRERLVLLPKMKNGDGVETLLENFDSWCESLRPHTNGFLFDLRSLGDGWRGKLVEAAEKMKGPRGKEDQPGTHIEVAFLCPPETVDVSLVSGLASALCKTSCRMSFPGPHSGEGPEGAPFVDLFAATLKSDRPDGLFTTVVCDESGVALGLVYSNVQSLHAAVECMRGVYWSRSRGGLWRKGDTSGAWQGLLSIDVDCDRDAIRFRVVQQGEPPAFCHLQRRTCWSAAAGLRALEETLKGRLKTAPAGSYTKRLFEDPQLLRHKLLEEAQELSEATEKDHVAAEAADLIFFALTRCTAAGVSLPDIEAHLDRRALKLKRRPGNAKQERILQAARELNQGHLNGS
uniref:Phosphoribosyl-AMP cyclohydrolase domain-containing protein n=1 Tax=Chromera velia CCMP2878 TaxID=1169474 RepID=A0A0G4HM72_9ALVE|mmetsp:Transcript_23785/g.46727  ORF Transcript_23785/g.46727 Transcript_23785/m.46727 type:complete len:477 (+) Transcript_23785:133-1563(+)|eukprot:Cvel_28991.t1-p1 / transcript=Cvel_28991.t1 / gene=Cvel_28991 / organism=Chromera_velia_CCMP2878 / gene_product=Histidine biosynthesis bifunctional protein his7, putative / transcript_product=Histidine biosynthesis bifunctional protein his7, putative / location=Cvel_scaffold3900:5372-8940(-) / protein_length=476 / sequence_SO=supercontig / SO=protein_coding / is_pseudo=false